MVQKMIEVLGFQFDLISLIPVLFGVVLSLYNYHKITKPANLFPTEIVNLALIPSSYENSFKIILLLGFHNEKTKEGIIKKIKIGFKQNIIITYLDSPLKVRLNELEDDLAQRRDWTKFAEQFYRVIQQPYPIYSLSDSSLDVTFIATCSYEEEVLPNGKQSEYVIKVFFENIKSNKVSFPFHIAEKDIPADRLIWLVPASNIR